MTRFAILLVSLILSGASHAQTMRPYEGFQTRTIKALSAQQIDDLKAGRGMSLALAAELNGYPGPAHVLELADQLDLSAEQRARVGELFATMKAEAAALGEQLIADEAELDRLFATQAISPAKLKDAVDTIAGRQSALRAAHLRHHLTTRDILNPTQIARYAELRGYAGPAAPEHQPKHHRHH